MIKPSYNVPFEDARKILAHDFGVEPKDVIKNQYSFTVLGGTMPEYLKQEEQTETEQQRIISNGLSGGGIGRRIYQRGGNGSGRATASLR